ncbi:MAG: hypothetical protein Q9184_006795 [Pyrenodesmia sp. 2 TL-2023]
MDRADAARAVLQATRDNNPEYPEYQFKDNQKVVKHGLDTSGANHYTAILFLKGQILETGALVSPYSSRSCRNFVGIDGKLSTSLLAGFDITRYMFSVMTLDRCGRRSE